MQTPLVYQQPKYVQKLLSYINLKNQYLHFSSNKIISPVLFKGRPSSVHLPVLFPFQNCIYFKITFTQI